MIEGNCGLEYKRWCENIKFDDDLIEQMEFISDKPDEISDAFYKDLKFGTGGLRGVIGVGTNRMNIYTVAKASQGLANYVLKNFSEENRTIAVSYDSRIKSDLFAKVASCVFASNNISVFIYDQLMPTPCLSFAVRELNCSAGVMITASHNPSKYNGYKVYGSDGGQITTKVADYIYDEIKCIDIFTDIEVFEKNENIENVFNKYIDLGIVKYISEDLYTTYIEAVKKESLIQNKEINKDVAIVYTPLNGTGRRPVLRALMESGYTNITVVKEQEMPDGNFPTCPYPNPEVQEAMHLGIEYAKKQDADLLLATDPDCDRVGIAVKDVNGIKGSIGEYVLLSGNDTGVLLLDYICLQHIINGTMPNNPVFVKTIVTTDLAEIIARNYGLRTINVLTGFKYIGEQIGYLEKNNEENAYVFGFEESYGYLSGSYVRDKDGVNASLLICDIPVCHNRCQ